MRLRYDENKIKTANGLQKTFESSFGMVAVDVQLQDYLLSHYETVVNHNFDLEKIRYERRMILFLKQLIFLRFYLGQLL